MPAGEVVLCEQAGEGGTNLCSPHTGRLDRVGVVGVLRADEAQVDEGQAIGDGEADDDVVEGGEGRDRHGLLRLRKARVVDRADGSGQAAPEHGGKTAGVVLLEFAAEAGKAEQSLGHRDGGLTQKIADPQGIVAAATDDEVGSVGGQVRYLPGQVPGGAAVDGLQAHSHPAVQTGGQLPGDIRFARLDIGTVIEDRIAEQDDVAHDPASRA